MWTTEVILFKCWYGCLIYFTQSFSTSKYKFSFILIYTFIKLKGNNEMFTNMVIESINVYTYGKKDVIYCVKMTKNGTLNCY